MKTWLSRLAWLLGGVVLSLFVEANLRHEPKLELRLDFDEQAKHVVAYTYYLDKAGREVRHGDYYEFDCNGRSRTRIRYEHGSEVGGTSKFN